MTEEIVEVQFCIGLVSPAYRVVYGVEQAIEVMQELKG